MTAIQFEAGKRYQCRSICDYACIWTYEVTRRTAKTVWLKAENGFIERKKIVLFDGVETCWPKGHYSMAPILAADKRAPL